MKGEPLGLYFKRDNSSSFIALRVPQPLDCDVSEHRVRIYPDEKPSLPLYKKLFDTVTYWDQPAAELVYADVNMQDGSGMSTGVKAAAAALSITTEAFSEAVYHKRCRTAFFFDDKKLQDLGATFNDADMSLEF